MLMHIFIGLAAPAKNRNGLVLAWNTDFLQFTVLIRIHSLISLRDGELNKCC